jgi:hypothetical protein
VHDDGYFEYLFGDTSYLNKEMFIMRKIGRCEVSLKVNHDVINALKKCMLGIKCKWNRGLVDSKGKWK